MKKWFVLKNVHANVYLREDHGFITTCDYMGQAKRYETFEEACLACKSLPSPHSHYSLVWTCYQDETGRIFSA